MANRVKEDEKNERIIRGLLKLAQNRRCINCNSLGPQYVCTNFWTFVCTTCSGIHREFTHRVKSVSMAKFTSQEVAALQEGGNQRARDIYFKEWDSQRQSSPDSSNVERLRDFIRHVYVDRRYTGERNSGKPPSMKMDNKEEFYENRRNDAYRGSRSPPYEDTYEHRYSERSSPGGRSDDKYSRYSYDERRSPGYDQESRQYNNNTRSPARPEIINDWRREDRFGNGRKVEDRRISDGDSKLEGRSPEWPKEDNSSPPMVRPVREILGDNIVPLRISEPPKANILRAADVTAQAQRTASSSSLGSANGNPVEVKLEKTGSLIDFDADPEPPASASIPQAQQTTTPQSIAQPASATNDNNWASFDFAPDNKASQAPPNANPLESVLSQLSVPVPGPGHLLAPSGAGGPATAAVGNATSASLFSPAGNTSMLPFNSVAPAATPVSNLPTLHAGGVSTAAPGLAPAMPVNGGNSFVNFTQAGQWPNVQHQQPSLFPVSTGRSTSPQFTQPLNVASANQTWNVSPPSNVQVSLATPYPGAQIVSKPASGVTSAGLSQPPAVEVKPAGRRELPEDLFAATFSSYPVASPGWQTGPARGMGFAVQYNSVPAPIPTYLQPSKSANPFDLSEPVQAQHFPSLTSLHAALPNMPPSQGIQRPSSLGTPSPAWMSSQSSPYPPTFPSQAPSYSSSIPPRAFVAQQAPSSMPFVGHQVGVGFGSDGAAFGSVNMDQQVAGRFSGPPNPQPFSSVGGNPFG